jgi:transcription elongation factor Elf1
MKTYNCKCCGSKNVSFDANAKWNVEKQEFEFELQKFYLEEEMAFCDVCDNWTDFEVNEE